MKKLYFLNEEESIRILNLHKDATKRQYLKEIDEDEDKRLWANYPCIRDYPGAVKEKIGDGSTSYTIKGNVYYNRGEKHKEGGPNNLEPYTCPPSSTTPEVQTPTPVVQKPVQSVNKPLVMDIQKKLIDKGISLGKTGDNKDGVDGVMGKLTLNGIIGLLGKPEPLKPIDLTATPLTKKPTEDLIKPVTTTGTPVAGATEGTPVVAGATAETPTAGTPTAAAATTGTSPQATEKDL